MATRTIANAGGNWNTAGTWVENAVPTSADDVVATGTSGALTLDAAGSCRSIDLTGYTSTFALGTKVLTVGDASGGALKLAGTITFTVGTLDQIVFAATSDNGGVGWGITTGGKTMPSVNFNGAGGRWRLLDAYTCGTTSRVTLSRGTLDTNSQACSWGLFNGGGNPNSQTRALTLGSSIITITGTFDAVNSPNIAAFDMNPTTGMTFTPGTSTIKFTNVAATGVLFNPANLTFFNVTRDVTGSTADIANILFLSADLVCSGTFTANGITVAPNGRITIMGGIRIQLGGTNGNSPTIRTITAATVSISNCNFQDVIGAGAGTWSGTSVGDCGGNTGITVDAPVTRYAIATGNMDSTTKWATSSGGASGATIPLPQDTAFFDAAAPAGTYTMNFSMWPTVDCANGTGGVFARTLSVGTTTWIFGSLTLTSGMTFTDSAQTIRFASRSVATLTSAGKTHSGIRAFTCRGATLTLQDDLVTTAATLRLAAGTIDMNGHNITCPTWLMEGASSSTATSLQNSRTINMRGGTITLNGTGTVWNTNANTTFFSILWTTGALIDITDTSATQKTFQGGATSQTSANAAIGMSYPKVRHIATGSAALTFTSFGALSFDDLDLECTTNRVVTIPVGVVMIVRRKITLNGASGQPLQIASATPGTSAVIHVEHADLSGYGSYVKPSSDVFVGRRTAQPGIAEQTFR